MQSKDTIKQELAESLTRIGGRPPVMFLSDKNLFEHKIMMIENSHKTTEHPDDYRFFFVCLQEEHECSTWFECRECSHEDTETLDMLSGDDVAIVHDIKHNLFDEGWLFQEQSCCLNYAGPGSMEIDSFWRTFGPGSYRVSIEVLPDDDWLIRMMSSSDKAKKHPF